MLKPNKRRLYELSALGALAMRSRLEKNTGSLCISKQHSSFQCSPAKTRILNNHTSVAGSSYLRPPPPRGWAETSPPLHAMGCYVVVGFRLAVENPLQSDIDTTTIFHVPSLFVVCAFGNTPGCPHEPLRNGAGLPFHLSWAFFGRQVARQRQDPAVQATKSACFEEKQRAVSCPGVSVNSAV